MGGEMDSSIVGILNSDGLEESKMDLSTLVKSEMDLTALEES